MGNAVIRLGHEMNGTWYHDGLGNDPAQYGDWTAYWARIVTAMRSVPGARFLFDWNVNAGYRNIPLASYYPGDSVVDVIGVDVYDSGMPGNPRDPAVRWTRLDHEPGGLAQIVAFARQHGKPLSVPEWGVVNASGGGLGDDPAYVTGIAGVVKDNDVVYQAYFDRPVGGVMALKDAPRSLRLWMKYFGAAGRRSGGGRGDGPAGRSASGQERPGDAFGDRVPAVLGQPAIVTPRTAANRVRRDRGRATS